MNENMKNRIKKVVMAEFGIAPRVKVLTFGGAAGRIGEYIAKKDIAGVKVIAVNVDRKVEALSVDRRMRIGKEILGVHSDTNGEVNVARYMVDRTKSWIIEEVRDADAVVLIAALGGGMGTGGLIETMRILKSKITKPLLAIAVLPFSVERERRRRAEEALEIMEKEDLGTFVTFDSDLLLKKPTTTLAAGYESMYRDIFKMVERIAKVTVSTIERKFEELYLEEFDSIVEKKYAALKEENMIL